MRVNVRTLDDMVIVSVAGKVDSHSAGHLYDILVDCAAKGRPTLLVDVSGVSEATHAGARGLIVAAKLMRRRRHSLRICGATEAVATLLRSFGFDHLIKIEPNILRPFLESRRDAANTSLLRTGT